jgi:diadenosine tetraphosphatase ApaH/serine/threonine PP2A family protein phosphatase
VRYLIISDIHANLAAFESVLNDVNGDWDIIWCLGDVVGYGPDPNECVELLRQHKHLCLSGNHDWAVLGRLDINTFNDDAQKAITWTRGILTEENRLYLEKLPSSAQEAEFTLAHGSPRQPVWEYIADSQIAIANFEYFMTPYCLVGHTHSPVVYEQVRNGEVVPHLPVYGQPFPMDGCRMIINPGSVGQPRDYDPRASYAILDTENMTWEHRRVLYSVQETQWRMNHHHLPFRLIARLQFGW